MRDDTGTYFYKAETVTSSNKLQRILLIPPMFDETATAYKQTWILKRFNE